MINLSVALITYNEEHNIERTLLAIKDIADEIIIVDSHSTDNTKAIAESLGAVVYTEDWRGYGAQKNEAIDKCKGRWILMIDADEVVSKPLAKRIAQVVSSGKTGFVYLLNRSTICFGTELKYGGWSQDYIIRLFEKGAGSYSLNLVHERFETTHPPRNLTEKLYHYSYKNMDHYLKKQNIYTTLGAQDYFERGKKADILHICFSPMFKFVKTYFFQLGFLDGISGLVVASVDASYTMIKYFKLKELYKQKKQNL